MPVLNPTPRERMVDDAGRPYFLWDVEMTLEEFEAALREPDEEVRAYLVGKLMRQAKPDDALRFVSMAEIDALWDRLERYLGRSRAFWTWLRDVWRSRDAR